jgi:hypothetical protein
MIRMMIQNVRYLMSRSVTASQIDSTHLQLLEETLYTVNKSIDQCTVKLKIMSDLLMKDKRRCIRAGNMHDSLMRAYFDAFESIEVAIRTARQDPSMYTVTSAANIVKLVAAIDQGSMSPIPTSVVMGRQSDVDAAADKLAQVLRQRQMIEQRIAALRQGEFNINDCTLINPQ